MTPKEIEDLYLRSLDEKLDAVQLERLAEALRQNPALEKEMNVYKRMREVSVRKSPATFGPYFSRKVMYRIEDFGIEIDRQIMFFFRKYQLAALGIVMALLAINVIFADRFNVDGILGIEQPAPAQDNGEDELGTFDYAELLTDNDNDN